jgi:hypothetical protein
MDFNAQAEGSYEIIVLDRKGKRLATNPPGKGKSFSQSLTTNSSGWLTLQIKSAATNTSRSPYHLKTSYQAPQQVL